MHSSSVLKSSRVASAVICVLQLASHGYAAAQCDVINSADCGTNSHHIGHKLPTSVGSTFYANGFHGGIMHAKFQSMHQSVPGNSEYVDLKYNFNLGDYDGTYWIILPTSFGKGNECYAVYKNCDVTISFWEKATAPPNWYTLA
ncbi:hypothetical protein MBLNU13_g09128t1 [Cladosporium sp. NU13]